MRRMRTLLITCLSLGASFALAAPGTPPGLKQFAYAQQLQLDGHGAAYQLKLPTDVYAGLTRDDLGDLRVFNAAGELVPYQLRLPSATRQASSKWTQPPIFPLKDATDAQRVLALRVQRGDKVERLTVDREASTPRPWGYLVDLGDQHLPVDRLQLDWADAPDRQGFITRISIDASDDLEDWFTLLADATVARLHHKGRVLTRGELTLPEQRQRYLRIRLHDGNGVPELRGVRLRQRERALLTSHELLSLDTKRGYTPGEYLFELPGALPVYRLRITPTRLNTATRAEIYTRQRIRGDWRLEREVDVFRLASGRHEVTGPDVEFPGLARRQWRIKVDLDGGGLAAAEPKVEVYWQPHELTFLARGDGPYTLAWGSVHVTSASKRLPLPGGVTALPARLTGPVSRPGGDEALVKPTDWKEIALWLVLALGAGLMGWMGFRLLRQLDAKGDGD